MEVKEAPTIEDAWDLLDPGDYFETDKFEVFKRFLNGKGTKVVEINASAPKFTLIAKGSVGKNDEKSCVFFHQQLTNISRPRKIEIVEMVFSHPGINSIERNRIGNTLAAYFGVQKEIDK